MAKIKKIHAREILDSRGNPTVSVDLVLSDGTCSKAFVPSGASTGEHEALELRDQDPKRYMGKGVLKAVANVNGPIFNRLKGQDVRDQKHIDTLMLELDGTENKKNLGANAILGVSLAAARAAASFEHKPLFMHLSTCENPPMPVPMMNIINGGAHADNHVLFQEFMIRPHGFTSFRKALRAGAEVFHTLKNILKKQNLSTNVGDEGGFAPNLSSTETALDLILEAITQSGYQLETQISIALDVAASFFYDKEKKGYLIDKKKGSDELFSAKQMTNYYIDLCNKYPIDSIEDPLDENDWEGWVYLTKQLSDKIQIVGDDLFVTNRSFLQKGIEMGAANAILVKINQIGSISETISTIELARQAKYHTVISHRSGETEDTSIADLSVGWGLGQIKTGSLSRSERTAKYNRLLEIEDQITNPIY